MAAGNDGSDTGGVFFRVDEILSALSTKSRRYILYYLQEAETATLDDLTRQLVAWETNQPPADVAEGAIERKRVQVYHHHLPKLAESHLIEFDERSGAVRYKHPPTLLEQFLSWCAKLESPSSISTDQNS